MMNLYRQSNDRGNRRLWYVTIFVVVLFLLDIVSGGKVRALVRGSIAVLSSTVGSSISAVTGSGFFSSRASLEAQNRALADQLAQYEERAAGYAALQDENDQLRALTHLAETTVGITAPIVSSVIASPYGTFLIGAGSADGVARGNLVLTGNGFVLGQVSDVGPHTSTVSALFSPQRSLDAVIHGTAVVVSGSGGGNAHASVSRGAPIFVGDAVVSPEFGQRPIGIVGRVASSSAQASQEIYIRLPLNQGGLRFVYVVSS